MRGPYGLPSSFRTLALLRALNLLAIGAALAAITSASLASFNSGRALATTTCLSTFVYGTIGAHVLRSPRTVGAKKRRLGWVVSIPLAAANAGTSVGLWLASRKGLEVFLPGFLGGVVLGALLWGPMLVATLVCFGLPIARAQKLARRGLAGEESGERIVGIASVVMSLLALVVLAGQTPRATELASTAQLVISAFAGFGVLSGGLAAVLASVRENARRRFVRAVEAGKVAGYRIEANEDGKVLVRVSDSAEGYRIAPMELPLFELDDGGEARALISPRARPGSSTTARSRSTP